MYKTFTLPKENGVALMGSRRLMVRERSHTRTENDFAEKCLLCPSRHPGYIAHTQRIALDAFVPSDRAILFSAFDLTGRGLAETVVSRRSQCRAWHPPFHYRVCATKEMGCTSLDHGTGSYTFYDEVPAADAKEESCGPCVPGGLTSGTLFFRNKEIWRKHMSGRPDEQARFRPIEQILQQSKIGIPTKFVFASTSYTS